LLVGSLMSSLMGLLAGLWLGLVISLVGSPVGLLMCSLDWGCFLIHSERIGGCYSRWNVLPIFCHDLGEEAA
jgi:hypothetical protein